MSVPSSTPVSNAKHTPEMNAEDEDEDEDEDEASSEAAREDPAS